MIPRPMLAVIPAAWAVFNIMWHLRSEDRVSDSAAAYRSLWAKRPMLVAVPAWLATVLVTGSVPLAVVCALVIGWSVYSERKRRSSGAPEASERISLRTGIAGLLVGGAISIGVLYRESGSLQFALVVVGIGLPVVAGGLALMVKFGLGQWGD